MTSLTWLVELRIVEQDGRTNAHAVLMGNGIPLESDGQARRGPIDIHGPDVGPEVAAARALQRLADRLLATASFAVGEIENAAVVLQPR